MNNFENDVHGIFVELEALLLQKHHDYGPTNISQSPGGPLNGIVVRMWDKFARIRNLYQAQTQPVNEPLEDSFKDVANYAVIALLVQRGLWDNPLEEDNEKSEGIHDRLYGKGFYRGYTVTFHYNDLGDKYFLIRNETTLVLYDGLFFTLESAFEKIDELTGKSK